MRTIDATLKAALATLHFVPYFKLKVYRNGAYLTTCDVLKYKLTGIHLSVTVRGVIAVSNAPESVKIVLERGIVSNGSTCVLDSSKFTPISGWIEEVVPKSLMVNSKVEAELIPPKNITITSGGHTYRMVINDFCTAIGKTAVFKNTGATFWGYQFHPNDAMLTLNNAQLFLPLLMQKRLIFCCDNGNEQILFYCALDIPAVHDGSIDPVIMNVGTGYFGRRRFFATDENNAVRFAGTVGDPLFNLGFIKSTESMPTLYSQAQPLDFTLPINLNYQDGDFFGVNGNAYGLYPAQVTEIFDPRKSPGWCVEIKQLQYFANTEGGSLPADLIKLSSYMPLSTGSFNGVLNAQANNVQSAMDMLDDHTHGGNSLPAPTADNDFLVGSVAGTWLKKTFAQAITILRTSLDGVYQAAGAAINRIVANTTALAHTEGYLRWDSTRKLIVLYDTQRERGITPVGWLPFAYPLFYVADAAYTTLLNMASGDSLAIPIILTAPMLLDSVSCGNGNATLDHTWGWDLYEQYLNNGNAGENTLTRIARSTVDETWTATVLSLRTIVANSAPVFLPPGLYWLVIQNRHATNTFGLCKAAISGVMQVNVLQMKTTSIPNGATLDFVAATWTKYASQLPAVRLNGRVFGQTNAF